MDKSHIFIIILFIIIAIAISGMTVCIVLLVKETKSTKKSNNLRKKVTGGTIEGYSSDTPDVTIFKGIPYASPPTSNLRWRRPQKVTKWDGLLECKKQKPNPMQGENSVKPGEYGSEIVPDPTVGYSEDCLTMNIWTNNKGKKMPVVFFVYGGAWVSGSNSVEVYNGEYLASQKVVFVCANYRVGLMGFLGSDVLQNEDEEGSTGNYGLMDLVFALQWVKENIEQFGGDPENVILLGGSAGANLIDMLMISPKAKGLFKRAVSMSYPVDAVGSIQNFTDKKNAGNTLIKNKEVLDELRKMPYDQLMKKIEAVIAMTNFGPCIDNVYIQGTWKDEVPLKKTNNVDFMAGFSLTEDLPLSGDDMFALMIGVPDGASGGDVLKSVYNIAALYRKNAGCDNTYLLQFTHEKPGPTRQGAIHDGHVSYFLHYLSHNLDMYWNESDFKMAKVASDYFINFCKYGNPNGNGLVKWEKSTGNREYFEMGDTCQMKEIDESKNKFVFDFLKEKYQLNL